MQRRRSEYTSSRALVERFANQHAFYSCQNARLSKVLTEAARETRESRTPNCSI